MLQKEISAFSCNEAPPFWFSEIRFGPNNPPICARAPPRKSMPNPWLKNPPNVLFVIVVGPRLEKSPCEANTPGPTLLLMSTGPAQATRATMELPVMFIPPLALWLYVPLAPMVTSDSPPTFKPLPEFPLLEQTLSEIPRLLETEMPSPAGLVTFN